MAKHISAAQGVRIGEDEAADILLLGDTRDWPPP